MIFFFVRLMGSSTILTRIVVGGHRSMVEGPSHCSCCDGKKWPMALVSRNSIWSGFTMFSHLKLKFANHWIELYHQAMLWIHPRFPPGVLLDFIWRHCSSLDFYQDHHQTKLGQGGRFEEGFSGCEFFVCFSCSSKVVRMDVHLWLCLIWGACFFSCFQAKTRIGSDWTKKNAILGCADSDELTWAVGMMMFLTNWKSQGSQQVRWGLSTNQPSNGAPCLVVFLFFVLTFSGEKINYPMIHGPHGWNTIRVGFFAPTPHLQSPSLP